ncbi:MAG: hypothetical protein IPI67_35280 [Myxococcales bacterium]|nr:hypothetical protein [Myxococcales bacterium]
MSVGNFFNPTKRGHFRTLLGARWFSIFALLGALVLVSLRAGAAPRCGAPGKPACPLQEWMRSRLALAFAKRDFPALERHLLDLAADNPAPAKWQNWSKFAKDGARAAQAGRIRGVVAACARCHSVYRPEYNARYRERRATQP